jgi:SpoVK/Ycf46/Vps4 family AAA+-type ATPase
LTLIDLKRILNFKRENSGKDGLIEFGIETQGLDLVGGLNHLKHWLELRRATFTGEHVDQAIDPPKGLLLLGVQGAGKSLAAKAVAGTWHVPLMRLDFGNLYSKWLGESEHNLKEALRQAEAMAPCVLWIDEIEKSVANDSGDADGGVSRRILGSLLTWMNERRAKVFLVATANDVSRLPPELLRKGRFDEIFFVDLPSQAVRRDIFAIHLGKRNLDPRFFDLSHLARASEGFSGSEIEQVVIDGMYRALGARENPGTDHMLKELSVTSPLSVVMHEKVASLRAWASGRTVPAD